MWKIKYLRPSKNEDFKRVHVCVCSGGEGGLLLHFKNSSDVTKFLVWLIQNVILHVFKGHGLLGAVRIL